MIIRSAARSDAPAILEIYAPIVDETAISFELAVPPVEEIEERIENTLAKGPWLIAEEDGDCLGYAYAGVWRQRAAYRHTAETAVYVSAKHRRGGVARKLYHALFEDLRARGKRTLIAGITLPNDASIAFHESLGFRPVGVFSKVGLKFDRWHDVGFWEHDLDGKAGPPRQER